MAALEVRVYLDSKEQKERVEKEAKDLGVSTTAFFRLLFKNYIGEITLSRKESNESKG